MSEHYKFFPEQALRILSVPQDQEHGHIQLPFLCYCPLYALGENCGGNYKYLENGIKDCSNCLVPHSPKGYDYVTSKYSEILELAKKK